jgi:hypothetical protein
LSVQIFIDEVMTPKYRLMFRNRIIAGPLSSVALPRLIDRRSDATFAEVKGVYGAATTGAQLNFAAAALDNPGIIPISSVATLLSTTDTQARSSWFAAGGQYIWNPDSTYGIEVVTNQTGSGSAKERARVRLRSAFSQIGIPLWLARYYAYGDDQSPSRWPPE